MNVSLQLQQIKDTGVRVDSCAYGSISAFAFKTKLNFFFTTFKIFINKWLAGLTVTVPSNIAGIFILSELYIEYYNNYIYVGATPTFIGSVADASMLIAKYSAEDYVQL